MGSLCLKTVWMSWLITSWVRSSHPISPSTLNCPLMMLLQLTSPPSTCSPLQNTRSETRWWTETLYFKAVGVLTDSFLWANASCLLKLLKSRLYKTAFVCPLRSPLGKLMVSLWREWGMPALVWWPWMVTPRTQPSLISSRRPILIATLSASLQSRTWCVTGFFFTLIINKSCWAKQKYIAWQWVCHRWIGLWTVSWAYCDKLKVWCTIHTVRCKCLTSPCWNVIFYFSLSD